MRDIARKGPQRHEEPNDPQNEQRERREQQGREQQGCRERGAHDKPKGQKHDECDAAIGESADRGGPSDGFAGEDRFFDEIHVLVQQHRRAIGEFAEEIEDNQSDENSAGVFGHALSGGKLRHGDRKHRRICQHHDQRRQHGPGRPQRGAAKPRQELSPRHRADELPMAPGACKRFDGFE